MGLLRQFPGYTLATLREEDVDLLRLLAIEDAGRPAQTALPEGDDDA